MYKYSYQWCHRKFSTAGTLKFFKIDKIYTRIKNSQNQGGDGVLTRSRTMTPLIHTYNIIILFGNCQ